MPAQIYPYCDWLIGPKATATPILLFWTRLVIGRKTSGGPSWIRCTVNYPVNRKVSSLQEAIGSFLDGKLEYDNAEDLNLYFQKFYWR